MRSLYTIFIFLHSISSFASDIPEDKATALDDMLAAMGVEDQMLGGFEAMMPMVDQLATQMQLNENEKEQLKTIYRDWFLEDIDRDAIMKKVRQLYAESFTTEEIKKLNDFYTSPTGQKFLDKSPELMKAGAQAGMIEAQKAQPKLMERLGPFMEAHRPGAPALQE